MKVTHRFAYITGGFLLGILLLFFILSGKKTSCDYGPESRTLKNIRNKERAFTEESLRVLRENKMDTSAVSNLLVDGDVIFSQSITNLDSCNQYVIEKKFSEKTLKIRVENCNKTATVSKAEVIQK